ncbi:MAG: thermonuclease [Deltaproteobacteria bacterium]|nr:thermonuclease [Deltaproteobacteria bacterium]
MLSFNKSILKTFWGLTLFLMILTLSPALSGQSIGDQERDIVLSVVDGDTLTIEHKGCKENLRLIGIDTPESRVNLKAKKDAERSKEDIKTITNLGKEATRFVRSLVKPGDTVVIEFDKQIRDKYGRLLGYVYLANGQMLNEEIVKAGYANLMTFPPNIKYQDRFLKAYREARQNNKGLWSRY